MTEMELLVDFHKDAERQGPGSTLDTLRALKFIDINKNQELKVVDIGCGSGGQTITIAENLNGHITAVDLFPEFLEKLNGKAKELGLQDKIATLKASMNELPFDNEVFDVIWSEGAIYLMGFELGIKEWNRYLKTGGYLAVSEISWTTNSRPNALEEYWKRAYPEIDATKNKIGILEQNGYEVVACFILPPTSWIDSYYKPMEKRFSAFLKKHNFSEMARGIVAEQKEEIRIYNKYKDYYSYGFYIAKKI